MTDLTTKPTRKKKAVPILCILALITLIIVGIIWWMNRPITPVILAADEQKTLNNKVEAVQEKTYEKGSKTLKLSEREINALFHTNTGLGEKVKFELANDAIHARVHTDLDPDLPMLGGKKLKAKARFIVKDENNAPALILEDLTLWGISLPNAWLAELKGENLLSNLGVDFSTNQIGKGIKEIKINNGHLTIDLAE